MIEIEEGVPLSKLTTIGTGGPARAFARPQSLAELEQALGWAEERGMPIATVGLGSNLLAADEGVDALVLRLAGELAAVETKESTLTAGGGATNAVCLHARAQRRARRASSSRVRSRAPPAAASG